MFAKNCFTGIEPPNGRPERLKKCLEVTARGDWETSQCILKSIWGEDPSQEYSFAKRQSDLLFQSHRPRPPSFLGVRSLETDIFEWGGLGAGHSLDEDQINHLSKSVIKFESPVDIGSMNM
jgi:hypothetical protein